MEHLEVSLCPAGCGACPDVEIVDDGVRIGETAISLCSRRTSGTSSWI
jgi:hypothetical protein